MNYSNKLFFLFVLFFNVFFYSQSIKNDTLRADFTYLLKVKLNKLNPRIDEELFSLQVGDNRAFFTSNNSVRRDSVIQSISDKDVQNGSNILDARGTSMPKTKFPYTIIQSNDVQYFRWVMVTLFTYKEQAIDNWKLINESKIINTINCKKAEVNFKGRNWTAWYSPEIPFPYGPYKFSGLPGLIIKITDEKGDYDFELVKSLPNSKLKGKIVTINKNRYTDAVETTQPKLERAIEDANNNSSAILASYGTNIVQGQDIIKQKQKQRELEKKGRNPIELDN